MASTHEIIVREQNVPQIEIKSKKEKKMLNPVGTFIGGLIVVLIGALFIDPPAIPSWINISASFLKAMAYFGMLIIAQGLLSMLRGLIGNRGIGFHQFIVIISSFISLASLYELAFIHSDVTMIPFLSNYMHRYWIMLIIDIICVLIIFGAISDIISVKKLSKFKKSKN